MSKPRRSPWVPVIAVLMTLVAFCFGGAAVLVWYATDDSVEEGTVLELTLRGPLPEGPRSDPFAELTGDIPMSLWGVRRALRAAAEDDAVAGLLVQIERTGNGIAAYDTLVDELRRFAASDKPVHVLLRPDTVSDGAYYLASGGVTVWATPQALWNVNGFHLDVAFWRGTLEKLHIVPEWIMFKEYKSAGEPYSRDTMSEHYREAMDDVVGDLQEHWFDRVRERRGVDDSVLRALVGKGMFTSQEALAAGLVDELGYLDEVRDAIQEEVGTDDYRHTSLSSYLASVDDEDADHTVAIVFGEGPIYATSGSNAPFSNDAAIHRPDVARAIRKAAEDDDVVGIVFRVDSPGGSAVGSDFIWREIQLARDAGKPVVVSMASVAGSGGYWVSMGADAIVAQEATITGSIGVVFGKFNIRGFYEWIGANVESLSYADNARRSPRAASGPAKTPRTWA